MVRPGVYEISPVSIYEEVKGGKRLEEEMYFKSRVIDGDRGGDDSVDLTCVGW